MPVLLSLLFLSMGCSTLIGNPQEAMIDVPSIPSNLNATYTVSTQNESPFEAHVEGFPPADVRLGNGQVESGHQLALTYTRPGWRTWTLNLYHDGPGTRLLSAQLDCTGQAGSVKESCPRNNPEEYHVDIYDAVGAPGLLGLGPFVGDTVQAGDAGTINLWDKARPGALAWTATPAPTNPRPGPCLNLAFDWSNATAKTPVPTLPYNRSITACQGIPLPVELTAGPIHWSLEDWSATDQPLSASGTPPSLPTVREGSRDCTVDFPPHNETLLPSPAFMDWAVENDSIISNWSNTHPDGYALPAYAEASNTGRGTTSNSYVVLGNLLLHDPTEGSILAVTMKEQHQRTLLIEDSSFEQSERLGSTDPKAPLPETLPMCPPGEINLTNLAETMRSELPFPIRPYTTFLAPEMMWGLQGMGPWTWPYASEQRDVQAVFEPTPWPYRAYTTYVSGDGRVAALDAVAMDPGGEWVRWVERDPPS